MISQPLTLLEFFRTKFLLSHHLAETTEYQYDRSIRCLGEHLGHNPRCNELDDDVVSYWLVEMEDEHRAPKTVHSKRQAVLTVWKAAAKAGLCKPPGDDVRRVKLPRPNPRAWTLEQLHSLVDVSRRLTGFLGNGLPRNRYFPCLYGAAYDTGLRRGDLFRIQDTDVLPCGEIATLQGKTLDGHVCAMSDETLLDFRWIASRLRGDGQPYADRPLRWPHHSRVLYTWLIRISKEAGVPHGALQQLRRTGATAVEREQPGAAMRYLGHRTPGLAYRHYVDRRLLGTAVRPPRV